MDWVENKYLMLISGRLEKFKRKSGNVFNFRCPICGDSETHQHKTRGYIYDKKGKSLFHCHNCNATMSLSNLIKTVDNILYNEMQLEKLKGEKTPEQNDFDVFVDKMKKPIFLKSGPLKGLKKVSQLSPDHRVKKFVDARKIPNPHHAKLFCCPNFRNFTNNLVPGKFDIDSLARDETRLLIPFFDINKNLHAYQGRALGESKVKYITIVLNDEVPKVYGLDAVKFDKTVYVLEGPIDSMFIDNSIATAGGDLVSALAPLSAHKSSMVIVYDNEPRSRDTIKKLDKAIMQGYNIVIWPDNLEHKDINDMILAGMSSEFITHILRTNTYRDLAAKLALTKWSKV